MNTIWTVFRKELVDTLRDRRTMMVSLIMGPLLSPLLMMGLFSLIGAQQVERAEKSLEVAVAGQDHAPNLVAWLQAQGVDLWSRDAHTGQRLRAIRLKRCSARSSAAPARG